MKVLKFIVIGSFQFVLFLMLADIFNGNISEESSYYEVNNTSEYNTEYTENNTTNYTENYTEVTEYQSGGETSQSSENTTYTSQGQTTQGQTSQEVAYSDANQTAPMPEELFSGADLLGKWVDETNPNQIKVVHFYTENNQLMYRYYFIVPGNSIGINLANEVTEWDCYDGMVSVMLNQGSVYCHRGTDAEISISFYYGFDGPDVMYCQEDGTAFYRAA